MPFQLPELPYAYDALEPYCDEATVKLHHDVHHKAYVDGLNLTEGKLAEVRDTGDFALIKYWERELAFHGSGTPTSQSILAEYASRRWWVCSRNTS